MIQYQIKENDGYLDMMDLPHNCIFNKVRTGCGATTIALRNEENYIIAVPTTELIVNKLNSTENLFGLYGNFTKPLKDELIGYTRRNGVKKIMCTYDKLPKLVELINTMDYRLLVDEYHNLLKQYMFRTTAVNGVLDNFREFKSFCFMSATPIDTELKPEVLKEVPEYYADWEEEQNLFIAPFQSNKPYQYVKSFISHYKKDGCITVNGHKSYEAFFFLNSVREIANIIKSSGLTNENCRVICADETENRKKLGEIEISTSVSESKQFNFITCKSFEGADFFSETGLCFVVSNTHVQHTLASIDIDIPQIAGRIRNKENPFRNMIVHIFNTKNDKPFISYEDYKEATLKELDIAKERVAAFNQLSPEAKKQQAKEVRDSLYIRYANGLFEVNDRAVNYILYEYKLMHQIYSSLQGLEKAYDKNRAIHSKIRWRKFGNNDIKRYGKSPTFLEVAQQYKDLMFDFNNARTEIERQYPFINEAFQMLGFQEISRLRTKKAVEEALLQAKLANRPNRNEMFKLLSQDIELGRFYRTCELKQICEKYGLKQIKELKEWYDIKQGTHRFDGTPQSGYWIKAIRA